MGPSSSELRPRAGRVHHGPARRIRAASWLERIKYWKAHSHSDRWRLLHHFVAWWDLHVRLDARYSRVCTNRAVSRDSGGSAGVVFLAGSEPDQMRRQNPRSGDNWIIPTCALGAPPNRPLERSGFAGR